MDLDKLTKLVWSTYQARLKHSSMAKDLKKTADEHEELKSAFVWGKPNEVSEESADCIVTILGLMCRKHKPASEDACRLMISSLFEWVESKSERTIERLGSGYYE